MPFWRHTTWVWMAFEITLNMGTGSQNLWVFALSPLIPPISADRNSVACTTHWEGSGTGSVWTFTRRVVRGLREMCCAPNQPRWHSESPPWASPGAVRRHFHSLLPKKDSCFYETLLQMLLSALLLPDPQNKNISPSLIWLDQSLYKWLIQKKK